MGQSKKDGSNKELFSASGFPNDSEQEASKKPSLKVRSVSSRKYNNLTTQVIDNHPESHSVCGATVIVTPMKIDQCVQNKIRSDLML